MNVIYVTADVAGVVESPVYAIFAMNRALAKLDARDFGGTEDRVEDPQCRACPSTTASRP
jgi:hypothetical protein